MVAVDGEPMDREQASGRTMQRHVAVVHELFGGELLKTPLPAGDHFYNRIEGRRYDFTSSQFDRPIAYADLLASRADAELGATNDQLAELRAAFRKHFVRSD